MKTDEADHRLSNFFKLLGNSIRLTMARLLLKEKHYVGELAEKLDRSEKAIPDHLRHFRDLDVVKTKSVKNRRYYWIKKTDPVEQALKLRNFSNGIRHDLFTYLRNYRNR